MVGARLEGIGPLALIPFALRPVLSNVEGFSKGIPILPSLHSNGERARVRGPSIAAAEQVVSSRPRRCVIARPDLAPWEPSQEKTPAHFILPLYGFLTVSAVGLSGLLPNSDTLIGVA